MRDLSTKNFTHEEIIKTLYMETGSREIRFRYDLLNREEQKIGELKNVISGEVSMNAFNNIKRTARFSLKDEPYITVIKEHVATWEDYEELTWDEME